MSLSGFKALNLLRHSHIFSLYAYLDSLTIFALTCHKIINTLLSLTCKLGCYHFFKWGRSQNRGFIWVLIECYRWLLIKWRKCLIHLLLHGELFILDKTLPKIFEYISLIIIINKLLSCFLLWVFITSWLVTTSGDNPRSYFLIFGLLLFWSSFLISLLTFILKTS